jgi:hypothetical protein
MANATEADKFQAWRPTMDTPAVNGAAVTPSDTVNLPTASRALYVGTAGNVAVITVGGSTMTLVAASGWMPICVARVLATGTTASDIVAVW